MPNKQLTARVRLDTSQAEKNIDNLVKKLNKLDNIINQKNSNGLDTQLKRSATAANKLNQNIQKTASSTNNVASKLGQIRSRVQEWANKQLSVNSSLKSSKSLLGGIWTKLKGIAATYLGIMGTKAVVNITDALVGAQNRLNYVNANQMGSAGYDSDGTYSDKVFKATKSATDKMYASAQKVRTSYQNMMSNVSKTMTLAGDAFGNNIDNAIRFQEIMSEAYSVGGASATEMASSMYQLTQALGAGILAGDELRSVREGAPLAYQAIEEFAQGVYNTEESLKDLASQGKITSEMVVAAIMKAGNKLNSAFKQTKQTFGQTFDQIKNAAFYAFQPVMEMLTDVLNKAVNNGMIEKFEQIFINVAKSIIILFKVIENAVQWCVENWNWLKYVIVGALILIGSYMLVTGSIAIATAIKTVIAWVIVHWQLLLVVLATAMVIYGFYLFQQGVITACDLAVIALMAVAIVMFLIFGWQVALIFAIIALVVWAFEYVCAIVAFVAAIIWNVILVLAQIIAEVVVWLVGSIINILSFLWNIILWVVQSIVTAVVWLGSVIVDIIIVAINVIIATINVLLGCILWVLSIIYNIVVACVNACLQAVWGFADPFIGIVEWILNVCNGGFNSFGGAVANLIGQIISWFLSLGKVVTKIIDAIFGTNWTGGLQSLQDKVLSWGKKEDDSITISREAPELPRIDASNAFSTGFTAIGNIDTMINPDKAAEATWNFMDGAHSGYVDTKSWADTSREVISGAYVNPGDWGKAAFNWGSRVKDSVNEWGSKFQNGFSGFSLDKIGNALGLNFDNMYGSDSEKKLAALTNVLGGDQKTAENLLANDPAIANKLLDDAGYGSGGSGFPNSKNPYYDVTGGVDDILSGVDDIAGNTGSIADSMDLTEEDLEYLRRIADMEWKNEYTVAEIKVDMTNNNTVDKDFDLHSLAIGLRDLVEEEMFAVADGVYAY